MSPWEQVWVPAPSDESLEVIKDLPEETTKLNDIMAVSWDREKKYHYCEFVCEGWIEGGAMEVHEDTIGPLSGRRGTVYHCKRCGCEIKFSGMLS